MFTKLSFIILFLFFLKIKSQEFNCTVTKNPQTDIYECILKNNGQITINVRHSGGRSSSSGDIKIECFNVDEISSDVLPELNYGVSLYELNIRNCPIPKYGFKDIMRRFHLDSLTILRVFRSTSGEFKSKHFEGLNLLRELRLEQDDVQNLDLEFFKYTTYLAILMLNHNKIKVYNDMFKNVELSCHMGLRNNSITHLPKYVFRGMKQLKDIDLRNNLLETIDEDVFFDQQSLEALRLSHNRIHRINPDIFNNVGYLRTLLLQNNSLIEIPREMLQNCNKLEDVDLGMNNNLTLSNYLFSDFVYLTIVYLNNSGIKTIPENIFEGSTTLSKIYLQQNNLKLLPPYLFNNLIKLKELHLDRNEIEMLDSEIFSSLETLEKLFLNHNFLTNIDDRIFENLKNLKEINLSFNKLKRIHPEALSNSRKLISFYVQNNNLNFDGDFPINEKNSIFITNIDFNYNNITQFPYKMMKVLTKRNVLGGRGEIEFPFGVSGDIKVNLRHNKISRIRVGALNNIKDGNIRSLTLMEVDISDNPIFCDCQALDLVSYIQHLDNSKENSVILERDNIFCEGPPTLANISLEKVNVDDLSCPLNSICTNDFECDCSYKSAEKIVVDCSERNLEEIPKLNLSGLFGDEHFNKLTQIEVHLQGNSLTRSPTESDGYSGITKLYLQRNKIEKLNWIPESLQVLDVEQNKLNSLETDFLNFLNQSNISSINFQQNPWSCRCESKNFIHFLLDHIDQIVQENFTNIRCNATGDLLTNLDEDDICPKNLRFYLTISSITLFLLVIIITLILMCCIYQRELLVYLYSRGVCLFWVKEERVDRNKIYDAFVTFAHQDENFVYDSLLPVLEDPMYNYKICIHTRDWVPGEFIATQITNSVEYSKRTIVVLSSSFLNSIWGQMEFKTAHSAAMKEGRNRVIIIVYGDINMNLLDDELKAYTKTNTYIKWGDPWFWEKLRYALPRTRNARKANINIPMKLTHSDILPIKKY